MDIQKRVLRHIAVAFSLVMSGMSFTAGASSVDTLRYDTELRTVFSGGDHTPLWLSSNLHGLGTPERNNGFLRAGMFKDLNPHKRLDWGGGIELAGLWRNTSSFYVRQLFGEIKYRSLGAIAGSKIIGDGFIESGLSTGGLLFSGNSLPIPQVRAGVLDYSDVWGCRGWFAVKGYMAYGKFTDSGWQKDWVEAGSRYTQGVLYNSRGLWLRGGDDTRFPLTGEIGVEMAAQFGGKSISGDRVITMPHDLKAWLKAILPLGGGSSTPEAEQTNVEGNQLGVYDIALKWKDPSGWSVRGYFQHYFEDQSQMTFEYGWKDALWGIDAKLPENSVLGNFVYEYIYTKDQTGPVYNDTTQELPEQVSGRDDYYDHYIYSGWEHWGRGIGNPLLISPIYNNPHILRFPDTRIIAHHFGFSGSPTPELDYKAKFSYTRNWGTYEYPYPDVKSNFSCMVEVTWKPGKLNGWRFSGGFGLDAGSLLGDNIGVMVSIGKSGMIKF